ALTRLRVRAAPGSARVRPGDALTRLRVRAAPGGALGARDVVAALLARRLTAQGRLLHRARGRAARCARRLTACGRCLPDARRRTRVAWATERTVRVRRQRLLGYRAIGSLKRYLRTGQVAPRVVPHDNRLGLGRDRWLEMNRVSARAIDSV